MSAENENEQSATILVILIIPSHRKSEKEISEKLRIKWRRDAQELFAELFGGSTAFEAIEGSYWSREQGKVLWDLPVIVEAYVSLSGDELKEALTKLGSFANEMKAKLSQESVMLVIDNYTHFI
ncbi:hypothetical protein [Allorhodopirellula solitaria]|uniref:Uncharacterized protein n=1 Tax=Allorhodopirellula solitaria TaxID=2527987 RepID=A0A5C5WYC1_9BACT|nr:hypothetical protein [Allorhodopirellula solitaria]TWT55964.1 hypothetical protein CA85_46720 [Allorhodopirellula solitaria]